MTTAIPLSVPELHGREAEYLQQCVESGFVSSVGPFVAEFEQRFADRVGAKFAIACSSGTAALHLALTSLGVGQGSQVPVSDLTFIASGNAIAYTGATPVLVDSEPTTWNLNGEQVLDWCEAQASQGHALPAAVEPVHLLGHPADLEPLIELRNRFGVPLVEDAAEALGATYCGAGFDNRSVGTVGDLGCFSFNGNKIITAGGGGMVVTDDARLADRVRHLSTQAKEPGRGYVHNEIGFNYRMTNLAAAVGLAQLEQLDSFIAAKRAIAARYNAALAADERVTPPPSAPWARSSDWLYSVLLSDLRQRDDALDHLTAAGVEARPLWRPLSLQRPFAGAQAIGNGDVARAISERGLSLPCSVSISADEQDRVVDILLASLKR